jgi:hypothetical protein
MTVKRSPREQRMAESLTAPTPEEAPETPEERAFRVKRNWDELKKARILALRQGNQKGVALLDAELEKERGVDFPHDADFDDSDFQPDDDFVADKRVPAPQKPGSQADVRKAEPSMALIEHEADERAWANERRKFLEERGGALKPGQTQSQAISEMSGLRDPAETREDAEAQHAADSGELTYGGSVAYNLVKPAAAIAGFAAKGPLGATAAEAVTRATAIGYNLDKALDKGMDPQQAGEIFVKEMAKGVGVDALFNFGAPVVGMVISKIPGLNRISSHIHAALQRRLGGPAPRPELHDAKVAARQALTPDPARKKAVEELTKHVDGDFIPTPGQVTGQAGIGERAIAKSFPKPFEQQEAALRAGADKMRAEVVAPLSQAPGAPAVRPDAKNIGERIVELTDQTIKATKDRLRPVFKLANDQKVYSDFSRVATVAQNALRRNADAGGGKLTDAEVGHLQKLVERYNPTNPQGQWASAEAALDFASSQKAMGRKLNVDGEPTEYFSTVLRDMIREADRAFDKSLTSLGQGRIKTLLDSARADYRVMNETAFSAAIKQALKKGDNAPEDIGRFLWQNGKVTRIEQLDEMLAMARREGVAGSATTSKLRRDVTRGFLQKAVQDVESAATWSKKLADPDRAATWAALTKGPDGKALKDGMAVLEQAAQMAVMRDTSKQQPFLGIGLSRAAGGGLGISWVTGKFNPWLIGSGLGVAGTMRFMATAYTRGDVGTINLIAKVLRANSTATAASAKALQDLVPKLQEKAKEYGITDLFMPKKDEGADPQQSGQQSEQSGKQSPFGAVDGTKRPNQDARPLPRSSGGVRG